MRNADKLDGMLDSLRYGQRLYGIDSMLSHEMKGLEISRAGGKIRVGHGYGNYGIRKTQLYFPNAQSVLDYLKPKRVNLDMLKAEYDPCLFNGL